MHDTVVKFNIVKNKVKEIVERKQLKTDPQIIAVTKSFPLTSIIPLLDYGHVHFGENKIQEAETKWNGVKTKYKKIKLHMLGNIQSNKAKKAVQLFDYIHSLDSEKLAKKIAQYENELNRRTKVFIQINLGVEVQKSGILLSELKSFYDYCINDLNLNIIGLMCLPPINSDPTKFFNILKTNSENLKLLHTSMGMSEDYEKALENGSSFLRLGTIIFGKRKTN
tara:strand:+ start:718 stop:1386 length:669 start_codon:yes stop_codon:yes gene_type:complete